jgi:hypothetical protein
MQTQDVAFQIFHSKGNVHAAPRDMSRFALCRSKSTEALVDGMTPDEEYELFQNEFLIPIYEWCVEHATEVSSCYVPIPHEGLKAFVLTKSPRFNFDLSMQLALLEQKLIRSGWSVNVMQLPFTEEDSIATFFNKDGALEVYADQE